MDLTDSIQTQLAQEVEDQELNKYEWDMLLQKWGIKEPVLTQSEKNLIIKEQRISGKQGF